MKLKHLNRFIVMILKVIDMILGHQQDAVH